MLNKLFHDRLNHELDIMGLSPQEFERARDFSKLCKIKRFQAERILQGLALPDSTALRVIADELEVNPEWLLGKSPQKHKKEDEDEAGN